MNTDTQSADTPSADTAGTPEADTAATPSAEQQLADRLARLQQRQTSRTTPAGTDGTRKRRRRSHPAKGARWVTLGLSLASTGVMTTLFSLLGGTASNQVSAAAIVPSPAPAASNVTANGAAGATGPFVVDGAAFKNKYGTVQVEATFDSRGALTQVTTLQTPDGRSKSVRINQSAVPRLVKGSLSAQSAHVDTVSGATYTSNDYRRSLQSAIDTARASQITTIQ